MSEKEINQAVNEYKEKYGKEPSERELSTYLEAKENPRGTPTEPEMIRIEDILRTQNGGREPTDAEFARYVDANGYSSTGMAPTLDTGFSFGDISGTNIAIVGAALVLLIMYWFRRKARSTL